MLFAYRTSLKVNVWYIALNINFKFNNQPTHVRKRIEKNVANIKTNQFQAAIFVIHQSG